MSASLKFKLEHEIKRVVSVLSSLPPDTESYMFAAQNLKLLIEAQKTLEEADAI